MTTPHRSRAPLALACALAGALALGASAQEAAPGSAPASSQPTPQPASQPAPLESEGQEAPRVDAQPPVANAVQAEGAAQAASAPSSAPASAPVEPAPQAPATQPNEPAASAPAQAPASAPSAPAVPQAQPAAPEHADLGPVPPPSAAPEIPAPGTASAAPVLAPAQPATPPAVPVYQPAYRERAAARALLEDWARARPGLAARVLELGRSAGGLELSALEFGAAGPLPLEQRPVVLLLGGLDGLSLAGCEAVLATSAGLLAAPAELPPQLSFVAVPHASPDALEANLRARASGGVSRRGGNATPVDEDRDGRIDEDGPDDLDGDGRVLDMLVEDPAGPWTRRRDDRFLSLARPGDGPRLRLEREGRDDDRDGRYNEDGPGGVCIDRNFPVGWRGPADSIDGGALPLSEPESRALVAFARARKLALVLAFQGSHGLLAAPGAAPQEDQEQLVRAADVPAFEAAEALFARATRRRSSGLVRLADARRGAPLARAGEGGAAIDWFYASRGALALELACWGPELDRDGQTAPAAFASTRAEAPGIAAERAFARWIDDRQGGLGFVDWYAVDLGQGTPARLGGWQTGTIDDPPPSLLPRALEGLPRFVRELAQGLPQLSIELRENRREGGLVHLAVRVRNAGLLPSGMGAAQRCVLSLAPPEGGVLIAGELATSLGHIAPGGLSTTLEWVVQCPPGSPFRFSVEDGWTVPVERELRL